MAAFQPRGRQVIAVGARCSRGILLNMEFNLHHDDHSDDDDEEAPHLIIERDYVSEGRARISLRAGDPLVINDIQYY